MKGITKKILIVAVILGLLCAVAAASAEGVPDGLRCDADGVWRLYLNGEFAGGYTGLYNDPNCGWWLISGGTIAWDYTGLWNDPNCGWWLISGGTIAWDYTGLWNDPNCGWWLISGGTIAWDYTGLWNDPNCGWWLINGGTIARDYTGLWYDQNCGWWLIGGGTIAWDYTGVWDDPNLGRWNISGGCLTGPARATMETMTLYDCVTIDVPSTFEIIDGVLYDPVSGMGMDYTMIDVINYSVLKTAMETSFDSIDEFTLNGISMIGVAQIDTDAVAVSVAFMVDNQAMVISFSYTDDAGGEMSAECMNSIRIIDGHSSSSDENWWSIHFLYGSTISEANSVLADKLIYLGDGIYSNGYFGVETDSSGKINWMAILDGTKYSLFGVGQGMGWIQSQATLAGVSGWDWRPINNSPNDNTFVSDLYPDKMVYFTKDSNGKVKNVVFGDR